MGDGVRFKIAPRDVPPEISARRLGMTLAQFQSVLPSLLARGFPPPDPDTGNFDLYAVDRWCDARHPHLFGGIGAAMQARDAKDVVQDRIANMRK
jgi:hypothetical protein